MPPRETIKTTDTINYLRSSPEIHARIVCLYRKQKPHVPMDDTRSGGYHNNTKWRCYQTTRHHPFSRHWTKDNTCALQLTYQYWAIDREPPLLLLAAVFYLQTTAANNLAASALFFWCLLPFCEWIPLKLTSGNLHPNSTYVGIVSTIWSSSKTNEFSRK